MTGEPVPFDLPALEETLDRLVRTLLDRRTDAAHWEGRLSSSPLSTATAIIALRLAERFAPGEGRPYRLLSEQGAAWLLKAQNADGGWGDTVLSFSNISTTALCWAALSVHPNCDAGHDRALRSAESWLERAAGGLDPGRLAQAIGSCYGRDRTFSAPILTALALAGRLGAGRDAWRHVLQLPFELAACPQRWFHLLRLPVVSYALPALIAIGQVRHHHRPTGNPLLRLMRGLARARTLRLLEQIQPASGGFLEAVPLTSFVVMSLVGGGQAAHPVAGRGLQFLCASGRPDGSWPIDTNLTTWVTTLSVNALAAGPANSAILPAGERRHIRDWILAQQYRSDHPYTRAAPGGWAWTDLPGGVPDADDTAGALLALTRLDRLDDSVRDAAPAGLGARASRPPGPLDDSVRDPARAGLGARASRPPGPLDDSVRDAARAGVSWLLGLQNRDGGIPTFCRGWGTLPFDRSSPDLTAHALLAWSAWRDELPALARQVARASYSALQYLARTQRSDGAWIPLWFGNQCAPDDENPVYGTARVLLALSGVTGVRHPRLSTMLTRGVGYLLAAQNADGGWGGAKGGAPSIEETALSVEALAAFATKQESPEAIQPALRGAAWLIAQTDRGRSVPATPIGFYFAKLWYFDELYPLIFAVGALGRVRKVLFSAPRVSAQSGSAR